LAPTDFDLAIVRRREFSSAQRFFQRFAENSVPPLDCGQLLRSLAKVREKAGDAGESGTCARMLVVWPPQPHWFFNSSKPYAQLRQRLPRTQRMPGMARNSSNAC
jgi:hypothetical protein